MHEFSSICFVQTHIGLFHQFTKQIEQSLLLALIIIMSVQQIINALAIINVALWKAGKFFQKF